MRRLAPVAVNQIQYNPWAPDWQHDVVAHCQRNNIAVTAWGPFQGTMMQHAKAFTVQTLTEIAAAKKKTVQQEQPLQPSQPSQPLQPLC